MSTSDWDLVAVVRSIFAMRGIIIKGGLHISLRFIGEGYGRIRLDSFKRFVNLFGNGRYYIDGEDVTVNSIGEQPFKIAYIHIDAEYRNGKWKAKLLTDEEVIFDQDTDKLESRHAELTLQIISVLQHLETFANS